MSIPQNKLELKRAILTNFDKLYTDLQKVPVEKSCLRNMQGHVQDTQMSVCQLLSYLIGWNELVLKWLVKDAAGEKIDFPETGYQWNELGKLALKFYDDYEGMNFVSLKERLCDVKSTILALIEVKTNAELYEHGWYGKWTMGRMIQLNTSSPYANARLRLRKWLKANSI